MNYPLLWKLAGGLYLQYLFCTMKDIAMELCEDFFFFRERELGQIRSKVKHIPRVSWERTQEKYEKSRVGLGFHNSHI